MQRIKVDSCNWEPFINLSSTCVGIKAGATHSFPACSMSNTHSRTYTHRDDHNTCKESYADSRAEIQIQIPSPYQCFPSDISDGDDDDDDNPPCAARSTRPISRASFKASDSARHMRLQKQKQNIIISHNMETVLSLSLFLIITFFSIILINNYNDNISKQYILQ